MEPSSDISAPAQNPRPAPVRMMTRTLASFSASCIEARISCSIVPVQALSLSGRFRVMVATRSATLYRVSWLAMRLGLYQCRGLLNKVVDAFVEMAEALVLGLSAMEAHVDLLQHHRQLKEREHFVIINRRQIAPGLFSVAPDELIARVPTRLRGQRRFCPARIAGLPPITKDQAQIDQRIANRGHLPIQHRLDSPWIAGV